MQSVFIDPGTEAKLERVDSAREVVYSDREASDGKMACFPDFDCCGCRPMRNQLASC